MQNKLKFFQHCAVEYIFAVFFLFEKTYGYFLLADQGGLGKTVQALKLIEKINSKGKGKLFLIICPANLKLQWIDFVNQWLPEKSNRNYHILIETFSSVLNPLIQHKLKKHIYDLLILDEGHYLINFESQRTEFLLGRPPQRNLILKTKKVLNMTATFCPNHIGDSYPFLWSVKSELIQDLTEVEFYKKYGTKLKVTQWGTKPVGVIEPHKFLKNKPWYLRRKIEDVIHDIPPQTRIEIPIEIDKRLFEEEKQLLKELLELSSLKNISLDALLAEFDYFDTVLSTVPGFAEYVDFKKRQGLVKIKPVFEYLKENVLPEFDKIILAPYHRDAAKKYFELLKKPCQKRGIETVLITGDISSKKRHVILEEVKHFKKIWLICTLNSVREGKNLQMFNHSYITEIDWRWVVHKQFELRTRRIGSKFPVFYNYFIFSRGMDKKILSVLKEKEKLENSIY